MKIIFYLGTLNKCDMTITDKIVYSQILYRSLWQNSESFDNEGKFSMDYYTDFNDGYVPIEWELTSSIAHDLSISDRQFFRTKSHLIELGYLSENGIKAIDKITDCFFELKNGKGLKGLALIVYSYIAHKSEKYGWVDKYHAKIAEDLAIDRTNLEHILSDLRNRRIVSVKNDGRRRLLRVV